MRSAPWALTIRRICASGIQKNVCCSVATSDGVERYGGLKERGFFVALILQKAERKPAKSRSGMSEILGVESRKCSE